MAIMHPNFTDNELPQKITTPGARGEIQLYRELRDQLPDTWHVLCDNQIFADKKNHQTDFLVFCPNKGIVNVDAKGTGYRYEDNCWYLGDNRDNIFSQAQEAIHTFDRYVKNNLSNNTPWGAYGFLVVFVDEPTLRGTIPGDCPHMRPMDLRDGKLRIFIEEQLNHHPKQHQNFTEQMFHKILKHFCIRFGFEPFSFEFHNNDKCLESALTTKQREIKATIESKHFVHITGGAGTGKTVLAVACAQSFAARNMRVLYVCYNKCLAENLSNLSPRSGNFVITHYDALPVRLFNMQIQLVRNQKGEIDWENTHKNIANLLCVQGPSLPERRKFDLILIDESQDMNSEMLYSLQFIAKEESHIAFFSDSAQSIFRNGWTFPEQEYEGIERLTLHINMRNTDRIHEKIIQYSGEETKAGEYILGRKPETFSCSIVELIDDLKTNEGVQFDDIVVLGYIQEHINEIHDNPQKRIYFTTAFADRQNGKILKTTVQSFKGLDANVIIIVDSDQMPKLEDSALNHLRYVGESRAKYRLYLHTMPSKTE